MSVDAVLFLAALMILALYALVFFERGVSGAHAPLAAVCAVVLTTTLFGCLGLLRVAAWLYTLGALPAAAWLWWRWGIKKQNRRAPPLAFWLFLALCLVCTVLLAARGPEFTTWDEFSFWGAGQKVTRVSDAFYVTAEIGWNWPTTQTPALISLGYVLGFWCRQFAAWQVYAAVDVLLFACVAALAGSFAGRKWNIAVPVMGTALLAPYLFVHYAAPIKVSAVYLDSLGDVPMGLLFAAGLAMVVGAKRWRVANAVPLCLVAAVLTLTKDQVGLLLALVVAGVALCDKWFGQRRGGPLLRHTGAAFARFGLVAGSAALAYLGWSVYTSLALSIDRTSAGGKSNIGLAQMPLAFLRDALGGDNEIFNETVRGMRGMLFVRTTLLGSGVIVIGVILCLVAFAALITRDRALRRRCIVYGAATSVGFVAYYLAVTMSYIYLFRDDQILASYERYVYPYYIGWFLGAVVLVGLAARRSRFVAEGRLALTALALLCLVRVGTAIPLQYTVVGFNGGEYAPQRLFAVEVEALKGHLDEDDRIFIVATEDDGSRWFQYCYEFFPYQVDYSFGGGDFVHSVKQDDGSFADTVVTPALWEDYLREQGVSVVLVDSAGSAFREEYGHLFEDGLADGVVLYRVDEADGSLVLRAVASG